jgi:beta-mannosidase
MTKGGSWLQASVPGCVHLDLISAKVIPDPFDERNEESVQWVHENNWVYKRNFQLDRQLLKCDRVYLECEGLDTLATIYLNGDHVATTDNMFITHTIDVTDHIHDGSNSIRINFQSPVQYVKPFIRNPGEVYWLDDAVPGSPFVRKAPYQWGWDWAPKLLTCGIWRPIRLNGCRGGRITDLFIAQNHSRKGRVGIRVGGTFERLGKGSPEALLILSAPDGNILDQYRLSELETTFAFPTIYVDNPQLWWPNGYGEQPLYQVTVSLLVDGEPVQTLRRNIGLRTLRLEQKKDRWGRSFAFVVNGVRIFCKGANWVPADSFPSRITSKRYEDLVMSAVRANMNMLRVWGGGFYEDERFYNLCDKHGILVWQDFMFSGGCHYPMDDAFLANVSREVLQVIRRLRHHPCLALWCGNNEMEWYLWAGWIPGNQQQRKADHTRLFTDVIGRIVKQEDSTRPYLRSSPCSSVEYETPNAESEGNGHYWEVWHSKLPYRAYEEKFFRFVTEFGVGSLPHVDTISQFARHDDWNLTGPILESHQKCEIGNSLIAYYVAQDFRQPKDLPSMVYLSQLVQAEAVRCAVEHWRRNRQRCMGTLYWQLNDCWPAICWSSIDYNHRWKALHYAARRFYAPVLLSAVGNGTCVDLHVTNDTRASFCGLVKWSLEDFDGISESCGEVSVQVPPESDKLIRRLDFAKQLTGDAKRHKVLVYDLFDDSGRLGGGILSFVPTKLLELPEPDLHVGVRQSGATIEIKLSAEKLARFVCVDLPGENLRLSDNFQDIPSRRSIVLKVESEHNNATQIRNNLVVRSVRDTY